METNESYDSNGLHDEESTDNHQLDQSNATHSSKDRNGHVAESQDEQYAAAASLMKLGGAEDKDVGSQEATASSSPRAPNELLRGTDENQENQQPASASQLEDAKDKREDESTPNSEEDSSTRPRQKKPRLRKKKRMIDESVTVEPTDYDVLFGRGGGTNSHPGNRRFRAKALELRDQYDYDNQSKPEKERIARELVQCVLKHGRFIEKGQDMLWHEVVSGYHTKASQQLREARRCTD